MNFTAADVALLHAAASLAAHAPERMRAAHLAPRLEALARRMARELAPREPAADPPPERLRAA